MRIVEFMITSAVLTLMPGPDIIFVVAQSMVQGRRAGISVALGLASGLFVHTAAAALGLSLLIASSPSALSVIKYAGIAYLAYMGFASVWGLRKSRSAADEGATTNDGSAAAVGAAESISPWKLYRTGITMNLLNPKVIIFFLALFPQFIEKTSLTPRTDVLILGATFAVISVTIFSLVALLSDFISSKLSVKEASPKIMAWVKASIYWAIAVMLSR